MLRQLEMRMDEVIKGGLKVVSRGQEEAGGLERRDRDNLFCQHLVWAHKQSELNARTACFFEKLIRTSHFDVVRPEAVQPLLDQGLLKVED